MPITLINQNGTGGITFRNSNNAGSISLSFVSQIVTDGLTLRLDASNPASYPGSGTTWIDIAGTEENITLEGSPTYTATSPAYFTFDADGQYGTGAGAVPY